jgi:hypothetical protein
MLDLPKGFGVECLCPDDLPANKIQTRSFKFSHSPFRTPAQLIEKADIKIILLMQLAESNPLG